LAIGLREFIGKLDLSNNRNTYLFTVVTCGTSPVTLGETFRPLLRGKMIDVGFGNSISDVQELLNAKGVRLSFGKRIVAYSNNILLHDMDDDIEIKTADTAQAADIIGNEIFEKTVYDEFQNRVFYKLLSKIFLKNVKDTAKSFGVNENCNACGLCGKICPVGNIVIADNSPRFLNKCEQCIACIQWYPRKAINYKNITQNRKRYHHPAIKVGDMIIEG
jgi:ferredoxin